MSTGKSVLDWKAIFKDDKAIQNFTYALSWLDSIIRGAGIILNITKDKIFINAKDITGTVWCHVGFDPSLIFDIYELSGNDILKIGIYKLGEFANLLRLFGGKTTISFKGNMFLVSDNNNGSALKYLASHKNIIDEGRDPADVNPKKIGWWSEQFVLEDSIKSKIASSMNAMASDTINICSEDGNSVIYEITSAGAMSNIMRINSDTQCGGTGQTCFKTLSIQDVLKAASHMEVRLGSKGGMFVIELSEICHVRVLIPASIQ